MMMDKLEFASSSVLRQPPEWVKKQNRFWQARSATIWCVEPHLRMRPLGYPAHNAANVRSVVRSLFFLLAVEGEKHEKKCN